MNQDFPAAPFHMAFEGKALPQRTISLPAVRDQFNAFEDVESHGGWSNNKMAKNKVFVKLRVELLQYLRQHLVLTDNLVKGDLIFVLAGHPNRKVFGARLFREGWAPRVLMSTGDPPFIAGLLENEVPPHSGNSQVWRQLHDMAARRSFPQGHYFAYLDGEEWSVTTIPVRWFGTLSEIKALADWLKRRSLLRSVLVVSSGIHLKRVQMCCRRLLPRSCAVRTIAVTVDNADFTSPQVRPERDGLSRVIAEWGKIVLYRVLLVFHQRPRVEDLNSL